MTKVAELIRKHSEYLQPNPTARLDTEVLLAHCLNVDRASLYREPERALSAQQATILNDLIVARKTGRPIAQLVGKAEFYSLDFDVNGKVLIPRADTELLVEHAIRLIGNEPAQIVDLGTGSGVIAISLAVNCPNTIVYAVDICTSALAVAQTNCRNHKLDNLHLVRSSWLESFAEKSIDMVVSNPPYIASSDPLLIESSISFEPRLALDGGRDGLCAYRLMLPQVRRTLKASGHVLLEHGYRQGAEMRALLTKEGFVQVQTYSDLANHERVCAGVLGEHLSDEQA